MTHTVVLVGEDGTPIGTMAKEAVHGESTPLHLAFSCYVLNEKGEVLVTRRSLTKATWPGVWTNSACGHLAPGETAEQALLRWVPVELGAPVENIRCVLPDFRYRAVDSHGVVENEICPVFIARLAEANLAVSHAEVDAYAWVAAEDLFDAVDATPFVFSPWMVEQLSDDRLRAALTQQ